VFFASPRGVAWWCRLLRPGFQHVYAASWYHDTERWVVFNPTRRGTVIELWTADEFPRRLDQFLAEIRPCCALRRGMSASTRRRCRGASAKSRRCSASAARR
jgi:hypothetical protein